MRLDICTGAGALVVAAALAFSGCSGSDGATGPQGPSGPQGGAGATGPARPAGATAPVGPGGPSGPAGGNLLFKYFDYDKAGNLVPRDDPAAKTAGAPTATDGAF